MKKTNILILAYFPYFLNNFANIYISNHPVWADLDYAIRLAVILFLFVMLNRGDLTKTDLGLKLPGTAAKA